MKDSKIFLEYIRNNYVISYNNTPGRNSSLTIRDIFESDEDVRILQITSFKNVEVFFIWGKIKKITGVDIQHKNFFDLSGTILKIFKDTKSLDFYKFLINEKTTVTIPLKEIPEEFPQLFSN